MASGYGVHGIRRVTFPAPFSRIFVTALSNVWNGAVVTIGKHSGVPGMKTFGLFRLDTVNHCLLRGDERVPVTPKAFDVLRYLVEHGGRLVSPDELLDALWPGTHINPEGIRKYILELRKTLGDRAGESEFIETLPKRGYQFVAAISDEYSGSRAGAPPHAPWRIVGREAGLRELNGCLDKAISGQRQVVFVTGEAGIGKTTLVDVFQQQVDDRADIRIARGQCIEGFGGIEAYYPMLEAMGNLLQTIGDSSLVQMLVKRAPSWMVQFPALVKPEQRESLQREILGATRDRMVREISEALAVITAQTPLIIILEDLHWVDPSTLDVISAIARSREPARLLLLGTYRPVDVVLSQSPLKGLKQDLRVRRLCHEIAIERLEESDVAEYLVALFEAESLPTGLASLIHRNSGGNPLFMAAIVQDMVDKGLIARERDAVSLSAPVEEIYPGIPESLQQMLEIQFELLQPEDQRILQSASIAGERFSTWVVSAMLDAPPATVEETCDRLAGRHQFILSAGMHAAPDGTRSAHYDFRHALYRQALYRSLSSSHRAKLHRGLGERLLPICIAGKSEMASEVALHFEQGLEYESATRCLIRASENAVKRLAHRDAIQVLRRALDLLPNVSRAAAIQLEIDILQRIGDLRYVLGEMSEAAESFAAAVDQAAKADLALDHVVSLLRLAVPAWYLDTTRGNEVSRQALEVSEKLNIPMLTAQAKLGRSSFRLLYDAWRQEDVEAWTSAVDEIASSNDPSQSPDVPSIYVRALLGDFQEACRQADVLIGITTNPMAYVHGNAAKGVVLLLWGRFGEVLDRVRAARTAAEKNGEDPWMYLFGESWLRLSCFDFDGVRQMADASLRDSLLHHTPWMSTLSRLADGYSELHKRNFDAALASFAAVRDFGITPTFVLHWFWRLHAALGTTKVLLYSGNVASAKCEAELLLEAALTTGEPNVRALAWEMRAQVAIAQRNHADASNAIESALAIVGQFDIPGAAWQVHRTAADVYSLEGNALQATAQMARAQVLLHDLAGSFDPDEPLRRSLLTAFPARQKSA